MLSPEVVRDILPFYKGEIFLISDVCPGNTDISLHYHQEYEIALVLNGRGAKHYLSNHSHLVSDIELTLAGPFLSHGWKANSVTDKKFRLIRIQFSSKALKQLGFKSPEVRDMMAKSGRGLLFDDTAAGSARDTLLNIHTLNHKKCLKAIGSLLQQMAASPYQSLLSDGMARTPDVKFEALLKMLLKRSATKITLEETAASLGMSQSTFNRFVKRNTGRTFINFLNHLRISYASRQLAATELGVAEIARLAGFGNLANFNRMFKKETKLTPLQYRERHYGFQRFL